LEEFGLVAPDNKNNAWLGNTDKYDFLITGVGLTPWPII